MTPPKQDSSFPLLDLIARLKPFGRFRFWGPIGITAILGLSLWQYSRHPEWLGSSNTEDTTAEINLDDEVGNNIDIGVNLPDINPNALENAQEFPLGDLTQGRTPVARLNPQENDPLTQQPSTSESLEQKPPSPIFPDLLPHVKNPGSLFPSMSSPKPESQPITLPELKTLDQAAAEQNPLKKAMEGTFSQDTNARMNAISNGSEETSVNSFSNPVPKQTQSSFNPPQGSRNSPRTAVVQPYTNPYAVTSTPPVYTNPSVVPPTQPYPNPYGNPSYAPPQPVYPQSSQPPVPNNFGNSNFSAEPSSQTPNQTQNQIEYGVQVPQINN